MLSREIGRASLLECRAPATKRSAFFAAPKILETSFDMLRREVNLAPSAIIIIYA
jgi:hypothetical protein